MSTDASYASFLDQANQDTGTGNASSKKASKGTDNADVKAVDMDVPPAVQEIVGGKGEEGRWYTSEADERFEAVSLRWKGEDMVGEDDFAKLIGHNAEVSTLSTKEFDPRGEYKDVFEAVEKAGDGQVRVFRVERGRARVVYYVVGFDKKGGRIVGVRVKAVES